MTTSSSMGSQRVAAGPSLGCRNQTCRISRSAASGRIAPISREYALCLGAVYLLRHKRTTIHRLYVLEESPLISRAKLLLHLNGEVLEQTDDYCTLHSLQQVTTMYDDSPQLCIPSLYFQVLPGCMHRISRNLHLSFRLSVLISTSPWCILMLRWST